MVNNVLWIEYCNVSGVNDVVFVKYINKLKKNEKKTKKKQKKNTIKWLLAVGLIVS